MQITQKIIDQGLLAELAYLNFRDVSLSKNRNDW